MSKTDKDLPRQVKIDRAGPVEREVTHAPGCVHSAISSRLRYETVETVETKRVRKHFVKMRNGYGVFFGAEIVDSGNRKRYVYDEIAHPAAEVVTYYGIFGSRAPVIYTKWVEAEVVETHFVKTFVDVEARECDVETGRGATLRYSYDRCTANIPQPHRCEVSKEMRRISYYGPERAHVRESLREAAAEYNTYGETDVEPWTQRSPRGTWGGGYWD